MLIRFQPFASRLGQVVDTGPTIGDDGPVDGAFRWSSISSGGMLIVNLPRVAIYAL